jgi:hypothetical protein
MRRYAKSVRLQRVPRTARRIPRTVTVSRNIVRSRPPVLRRKPPVVAWSGIETGPYLDYSRLLTPEGGILITYKDIDTRLRHILWRVLAWCAYTGLETRLLLFYSPVESEWITILCLIAVAAVNFFILWKLPELYRSVEIRPDCMIIEGSDVFWLSRMDAGWPTFQPDNNGNQVLSGIYGTRFVEYLTVRRFDDYDRAPEVFAAHLQEAMQQLWAPPEMLGTKRNGPPRWQG